MTRIVFWQKAITRQLSKKLKMFPRFFTAFLKSTFNFENCEKNDEPRGLCPSEVIVGEKHC